MGWFGVPEYFSKILTIPELVCEWNIDEYNRMLSQHKINSISRQGHSILVSQVTKDGTRPFVWNGKVGVQLYDIIHRHLRDGDYGVINRQPTLRIESMQGVRLKIIPNEYVFRLPSCMTRAFNADYDGDEIVGMASFEQNEIGPIL
jgi:DNA-directed RNA polymerase beta' subunit